MAKDTKSFFHRAPTPYRAPQGTTGQIFAANKTGAAPRDIPKHDAMTARQIAEGRNIGRDLSPGVKITNPDKGD